MDEESTVLNQERWALCKETARIKQREITLSIVGLILNWTSPVINNSSQAFETFGIFTPIECFALFLFLFVVVGSVLVLLLLLGEFIHKKLYTGILTLHHWILWKPAASLTYIWMRFIPLSYVPFTCLSPYFRWFGRFCCLCFCRFSVFELLSSQWKVN